ncbi:F-box domain-containing protein [Mycena venus]|uniref:F-box domain-containing protein n=1 Tax=Mycena venus TaxID=2733690 RepID=A0A8H6XG72_9AGAR|nr:F-box domain-containing protein [Mycena venus]
MDLAIGRESSIRDSKGLLSLPIEILEQILLFCHPRDVSRFSTTCRFSGDLVHRSADQYFWRELFLTLFDDPRRGVPSTDPSSYDWKAQLVYRMRAERDTLADTGDRQSALETFVSVAEEALPISRASDDPPASRNIEWLDNVLRNSQLLDASFPPNEAQLGDRIKTFMALSLKEETDDNLPGLQAIRTRSRCLVYDLRNYNAGNSWGPYLLDGTVNWTHMNCIINVVVCNLREQPSEYIPRPPVGLQAVRAYSAPGDYTGPDWAGVEGTWRRYVCFMDYRDLFAFNFSGAHEGPRDPSFFDDRGFREATRLIELNIHIIPREKMRVRFPSGDPPQPHPQYETLYFSGTSRGASTGQEAIVQGFVHMGPDHIPRWRLTSMHDGQPQWSSEGAQIGNVGSAIGVAGTWSAFHHGDGDPVGPFWLWKIA